MKPPSNQGNAEAGLRDLAKQAHYPIANLISCCFLAYAILVF